MALSGNGLGRGIKEVLERTARRDPGRGYLEVDIGLVVPSKDNPRSIYDPVHLTELANSIRTHGILQPLVVLKREVGFEILAGHRRYLAAKEAGLTRVPVVVREGDDPRHVAELRLVENIQRQDLNPVELAEAYRLLIEEHQLTHEDLADRVNKDRSSITNTLRLLTLPEGVRAEVAAGRVSLGHAKALLAVQDPAWQTTLLRKVIDEGLSVRATENLARLGPPAVPGTSAPAKSPAVSELEANLKLLLKTKVTIRERKGGKGDMTIHFADRAQLDRMIWILSKMMDDTKRPGGG